MAYEFGIFVANSVVACDQARLVGCSFFVGVWCRVITRIRVMEFSPNFLIGAPLTPVVLGTLHLVSLAEGQRSELGRFAFPILGTPAFHVKDSKQ